eukprot:1901108-Amphidinium_carterae.2
MHAPSPGSRTPAQDQLLNCKGMSTQSAGVVAVLLGSHLIQATQHCSGSTAIVGILRGSVNVFLRGAATAMIACGNGSAGFWFVMEAVVKVNLGGIVICTHVAMNLMLQQAITSAYSSTVGMC